MIIAGDTSGDLHGSKLVKAMKERDGSLFFCGIGGQALKDAGVRIFLDTSALSVVGVTEIFSKLPQFISGIIWAKRLIKILRPELLILIDFPGFNLPFSAIAKRYGIRILYYIGPQVWAWRRSRVKKIRRRIDHMAVILPFEEDFYKQHQVPATYVGHPLLDHRAGASREPMPAMTNEKMTIGLLPGSRDREITRHLPVLLEAAEILNRKISAIRFIVSLAPSVEKETMTAFIGKYTRQADVTLVSGGVDNIFRQSQLSVVASGTVTLEAALYGMPMVIIYKVSPITYWAGKALIRGVDYIGLVNLIAGGEVAPELIQKEASAENIAERVMQILKNTQRLEAIKNQLRSVQHRLGEPGASERVAALALNMISL